MTEPYNPGIIETIRWLKRYDFQTTDSGDGNTHDHECDQSVPYVHIIVDPNMIAVEADRLKLLLEDIGIEIEPMNEDGTAKTIEANYNAADGIATITLWNVKL